MKRALPARSRNHKFSFMKALWIKIVLLAVALPGVWGNVAAQVTISADFDTGSIGSVRRIDSVRMLHAAKNSLEVMSFGIRSRIDPLNPVDTALLPSSRWFHFRLEGRAKERRTVAFLTAPACRRPVRVSPTLHQIVPS